MIFAGVASWLLVGAWAALVWLPPSPWRPASAAAVDVELFEVFGSSRTSRAARRVLLVLLVVVAWPVFWRASCARRRASIEGAKVDVAPGHRTGPGRTIPPRVVGGA